MRVLFCLIISFNIWASSYEVGDIAYLNSKQLCRSLPRGSGKINIIPGTEVEILMKSANGWYEVRVNAGSRRRCFFHSSGFRNSKDAVPVTLEKKTKCLKSLSSTRGPNYNSGNEAEIISEVIHNELPFYKLLMVATGKVCYMPQSSFSKQGGTTEASESPESECPKKVFETDEFVSPSSESLKCFRDSKFENGRAVYNPGTNTKTPHRIQRLKDGSFSEIKLRKNNKYKVLDAGSPDESGCPEFYYLEFFGETNFRYGCFVKPSGLQGVSLPESPLPSDDIAGSCEDLDPIENVPGFWTSLPQTEKLQFAVYESHEASTEKDDDKAYLEYFDDLKSRCMYVESLDGNELVGRVSDKNGNDHSFIRVTHEGYFLDYLKLNPSDAANFNTKLNTLISSDTIASISLPEHDLALEYYANLNKIKRGEKGNEFTLNQDLIEKYNLKLRVSKDKDGYLYGEIVSATKDGDQRVSFPGSDTGLFVRIKKSDLKGGESSSITQDLLTESVVLAEETLPAVEVGDAEVNCETLNPQELNSNEVYNELACIVDQQFPLPRNGNGLKRKRQRAYAKFAYSNFAKELEALMDEFDITDPIEKAHFYAQIAYESRMGMMKEGALPDSPNTSRFFNNIFKPGTDEFLSEQKVCTSYDESFSSRKMKSTYDKKHWYGYLFRGRGLIQMTSYNNTMNYMYWLAQRNQGKTIGHLTNTNQICRSLGSSAGSANVARARRLRAGIKKCKNIDIDPYGFFSENPKYKNPNPPTAGENNTRITNMGITLDKLTNPCKGHVKLANIAQPSKPLTNTRFLTESAIWYWLNVRNHKSSKNLVKTDSEYAVKRITYSVKRSSSSYKQRYKIFKWAKKCIRYH